MSRFTLPRDIYHGKGSLEALKNLEGKRAMICVGGGSMKRGGFLDRAIASSSGCRVIIVMNKADQGIDSGIELYGRLGFPVVCVSARTGEGLEELKAMLKGRVTASPPLSRRRM